MTYKNIWCNSVKISPKDHTKYSILLILEHPLPLIFKIDWRAKNMKIFNDKWILQHCEQLFISSLLMKTEKNLTKNGGLVHRWISRKRKNRAWQNCLAQMPLKNSVLFCFIIEWSLLGDGNGHLWQKQLPAKLIVTHLTRSV